MEVNTQSNYGTQTLLRYYTVLKRRRLFLGSTERFWTLLYDIPLSNFSNALQQITTAVVHVGNKWEANTKCLLKTIFYRVFFSYSIVFFHFFFFFGILGTMTKNCFDRFFIYGASRAILHLTDDILYIYILVYVCVCVCMLQSR